MRIRVFSDLHLEFGTLEMKAGDEDVILAAGDIHLGTKGIEWLAATFPRTPVIYVAGNHEYYKHAHPKLIGKLRRAADEAGHVHFLENEGVEIGGAWFLGTTLWTDFRLNGDARTNGAAAHGVMQDFRRIRVSPAYRKLRPEDAGLLHLQAKRWLEEATTQRRPDVIITHHAPSALSLADPGSSDPLSAAFASNMDGLVAASGAKFWIHGHTHHATDYKIGKTRVLSNPRGYADEPVREFDHNLVLEL